MNIKTAYTIQYIVFAFVLLVPWSALGMHKASFFDVCIRSTPAQVELKANILRNAKIALTKSSKKQYKLENDYEREDRIVEKGIKKRNLIYLQNQCIDTSTSEAANLLYYALYNGFYDGARWLLKQGIDPNLSTEKNQNALHACVGSWAEEIPLDILQLLVEKNVPIDAKNYWGETFLYRVIAQPRASVYDINKSIDMLLSAKADPNIVCTEYSYNSYLYCALNKNNIEGAYLLIKHGAKVETHCASLITIYAAQLFPIKKENLDPERNTKLRIVRKIVKAAYASTKKQDLFSSALNEHNLLFLWQQRDAQALSLLDYWGVDIAQSRKGFSIDFNAQDDYGKTLFHDIIMLEKPDIGFFKRLLHAYKVDCSTLNKKNNNGNTFFHLLVHRTGINIFDVCEKLYTINKPGKPSGSQVATLLLMMHKRKDCILSVTPRKLLIHLINRFGYIWNDENSILSKELLSIQNKKGQTAYDSFIEMINGMGMQISVSKESGTMSEEEHEKVLKIAEAYYQEESNNPIQHLKKIAEMMFDPSRRI